MHKLIKILNFFLDWHLISLVILVGFFISGLEDTILLIMSGICLILAKVDPAPAIKFSKEEIKDEI